MAIQCGRSCSKNAIQIKASPPKEPYLLEQMDVLKLFLAWIPIDSTPVSHVNQSMVLFIKQNLFSYSHVGHWDLERDAFSWSRNGLNPLRKLTRRAEFMHMATKFEIVTEHIHHPSNAVFAAEALVGCLSSELLTKYRTAGQWEGSLSSFWWHRRTARDDVIIIEMGIEKCRNAFAVHFLELNCQYRLLNPLRFPKRRSWNHFCSWLPRSQKKKLHQWTCLVHGLCSQQTLKPLSSASIFFFWSQLQTHQAC